MVGIIFNAFGPFRTLHNSNFIDTIFLEKPIEIQTFFKILDFFLDYIFTDVFDVYVSKLGYS
jgi:hypothetical protein